MRISQIPNVESRSITFENPTGARGAGGLAGNGRKGAPNRWILPGDDVVLANIQGPAVVRHIWLTFGVHALTPEDRRSVLLEVTYDGLDEPSISVPLLDFFALPHGRVAAFDSELVSVQQGRGFNSYIPMPFRREATFVLRHRGSQPIEFFFQIDYTLEELADDEGYLHVTFRRENPTTIGEDFVIADGLRGPGRFLGCSVGIRVLDRTSWYGEGEVKMYFDDDVHPTICGTGLEDYVGTAWGMSSYATRYSGAPIELGSRAGAGAFDGSSTEPEFVSFYRWHVPDPVVFRDRLRVTIQQIGAMVIVGEGAAARRHEFQAAGYGIGTSDDRETAAMYLGPGAPPLGDDFLIGLVERADDYCATAYLYCRDPQTVPRVDLASAIADIALRESDGS
jgi:hypothetical protein